MLLDEKIDEVNSLLAVEGAQGRLPARERARTNPAGFAAAHSRPRRLPHHRRETGDDQRVEADGRHDLVDRNAAPLGEGAILNVELDLGLGMLGDRSHWRDDDGDVVGAGTPDLGISGGAEPLERPDPALIADDAVKVWQGQLFAQGGYAPRSARRLASAAAAGGR